VPSLAFASNMIWVLVIGLLGPSLPAMVSDLGISYAQAGFFFTLLSLGSLFGTSLGAIGSDYLPRKVLYGGCVLATSLGLLVLGFMPGYVLIALLIFLVSLTGSPMGAVGQSVMLGMFPAKREKYLSLFTFFGAVGSLVAPVVVSLNYSASLSWRWPFFEIAALALVLFLALLFVPVPKAGPVAARQKLLAIVRNRNVLIASVLIFASVGADLGFSYWLAEYFKRELHASLPLSSSVVGVYLVGIIAGRILIPVFLKKMSVRANLVMGLGVSLACIIPFILVPSVPLKIALCAVYGFGIGPLFPLLVAQGTREFPTQSGAVTGILYASLSLGGMVFPLVVGMLAGKVGIASAYLFCAAVVAGLLLAVVSWRKPGVPRAPVAGHRPA
jgi:FHS family glucose/mannose:H+ symporter-like MFS transporter